MKDKIMNLINLGNLTLGIELSKSLNIPIDYDEITWDNYDKTLYVKRGTVEFEIKILHLAHDNSYIHWIDIHIPIGEKNRVVKLLLDEWLVDDDFNPDVKLLYCVSTEDVTSNRLKRLLKFIFEHDG